MIPIKDRPGPESGISLVEVLVASTLTLILMLMGFGILNSSTKTVNAVSRRSVSSANAREAIDALEANLRSATGVWVCSGVPTTATCTAPTAPATVSAWTRGSAVTMFVTNGSGGIQPTCDEWTITSAGLQEDHVSGSTVTTFFSIPEVMAWVPPLATAVSPASTAQTTGFSLGQAATVAATKLTVAGIVVIDLLVNSAAKPTDTASAFDTADAVSVHDLISPKNLPSTAVAAPVSSC